MILKIKKINSKAIIPQFMTKHSAGMDIYACIDYRVTVKPMERVLISTGIAVSIPEGYELQIRPRSGLAIKHGITLLNTPGTIDADYRGEIKIILINLSNEDFTINHGDRIAQMVLNKVENFEIKLVENLDETDRGTGGFGSTGV